MSETVLKSCSETGLQENVLQFDEKRLKSIISIDAGRKYFSINNLKEIIDKAYANGYTGMCLIVGNDGFRFLLDDMTIEANNVTYSSEDVKKAILEGNKKYYDDPNGNALSQTEIKDLIDYTLRINFEIIPTINSPGHMDALIFAMKELNISKKPEYSTSKCTIDLDNDEVLNFTKALITKYIEYFSKTSKIFNLGLDEYANDKGGFNAIQKSGLYKKFVDYANSLAAIVKRSGMRPMAFNDGIYFNNKDSFGTFDKDIIVSYWTSGWNGYNVASADSLVAKGHKILNTNDGWYWVLGRMSKLDGYYHFKQAKQGIDKLEYTKVTGANDNVPIIGCMHAIWSDTPRHELNLKHLFDLMDEYSQKYSDYLIKPVKSGKAEEKENEESNNLV